MVQIEMLEVEALIPSLRSFGLCFRELGSIILLQSLGLGQLRLVLCPSHFGASNKTKCRFVDFVGCMFRGKNDNDITRTYDESVRVLS